MIDINYIHGCNEICRHDLVENIMPFWMKYGVDRVNGGVYTNVDRDGTLMDSTKSVWFQGRFGFICSYLYNNICKKKEWLDAAKSTLEFIEKKCFDTDGHMFFAVTAEGKPVQKRRYVFSECFAAIAMAEYSLASGDKSYANKALELFKRILIPACEILFRGQRTFHNNDFSQCRTNHQAGQQRSRAGQPDRQRHF